MLPYSTLHRTDRNCQTTHTTTFSWLIFHFFQDNAKSLSSQKTAANKHLRKTDSDHDPLNSEQCSLYSGGGPTYRHV